MEVGTYWYSPYLFYATLDAPASARPQGNITTSYKAVLLPGYLRYLVGMYIGALLAAQCITTATKDLLYSTYTKWVGGLDSGSAILKYLFLCASGTLSTPISGFLFLG